MERLDASIRRQLLKDDEAIVGKVFELAGNNARAVQANTRHMALMLLDTAVKDRATRAAAFIEELADAGLHKHVTQPVACAKGCSHCCTTYVISSLPEIFRLARALRGKAGVTARIREAANRSKSMPQLQREIDRVICPILEDHACSEYPHRPVICRAVLSTSLPSCIRFFEHGGTEKFMFPDNLGAWRSYLVIMLRAALVLAGLPYQNYELTHALDVVLARGDAEERWLAGEPVFAEVAMDRLDLEASPLSKIVEGLAGAVRPTI